MEELSELHGHRDSSFHLPISGSYVVITPRKAGKMLSSSNSTGCSKRACVVHLEDTMISTVVHDVKDMNDKQGCNSTKYKTQMSRQKNGGKRGDKKIFKVPMKLKFDSFSKKAGFASFRMASGGNNFLGIDKGRKATNTTEIFLHSVEKVFSILPLRRFQSHNVADMDSSCHKKMPLSPLSSVSISASSVNGDKEDSCSVDPSPCNKDLSGKPEMPGIGPDFSLCQPKDILERLALPPSKDLDSLLLDATKTSSSTRNNSDTRSGKQILRRASLPPFPWSHTINGCRTNPDAVKLLSNKSMCQG